MFDTPWDGKRRRAEAFLLTFLIPPLGFLIISIESRYLVGLVIIFSLWAARGIPSVARAVSGEGKRKRVEAILALAVAAVLALMTLANLFVLHRMQHHDCKEMALWIRENLPPEARIMNSCIETAFYLEKDVFLPRVEFDELYRIAVEDGYDYLLLHQRHLEQWGGRDVLLRFLMSGFRDPRLKLVREGKGEDYKIGLYEIVKPPR